MKIIYFAIFILLFTQPIHAAPINGDYSYSTSKENGIVYELLSIDRNSTGINLSGWAYINDTQHYDSPNDIKIDLKLENEDKESVFITTKISDKYDLTEMEKYVGTRFCNESELNKDPTVCNYRYEYVTFEATIPYSNFSPNHTYNLYLYINSKTSNKKMYTKVYADLGNIKFEHNGVQYNISSSLDLTNLKVNNEFVQVRNGPGTSSPLFTLNGKIFYYMYNKNYKFYDSKYVGPATWYKIGVEDTNIQEGNNLLVKPGSKYQKWISSNYVDYNGSGSITITSKLETDIAINKVYAETLSQDFTSIGVELKTNNVAQGMKCRVYYQYATFSDFVDIYLQNGLQKIEFTIPKNIINDKTEIKYKVVPLGDVVDPNLKNNEYITSPVYANYKPLVINDASKPTSTNYNSISGYEETPYSKPIYYYETITIKLSGIINKIPDNLNMFGTQYTGFYAGGSFEYPISISYANNYPYKLHTYNQKLRPILNINCEYIDLDVCTGSIKYLSDINNFVLPKTYISNDGNISNEKVNDAIFSEGQNVLFTNLNLDNGTYNFDVNIDNVGVNYQDIKIHSSFVITGKLIGNNDSDLFYFRNVNSKNLMPDYTSKLWHNDLNNLNTSLSNIDFSLNVKIKADAIHEIREYLNEDFQNNIKVNKQFKVLVDELINKGLIEVSQ